MALTLQQKLDQAEAAYHALLIGESAREVTDQNGEKVVFTAANASRLLQYINELKAQLGTLSTSRQPLRPFF